MREASRGKQPPEFLSDHPSDEHRIDRIKQWLPEAQKEFAPAPQN
jgi:Zn-dependent protease with chaperone function